LQHPKVVRRLYRLLKNESISGLRSVVALAKKCYKQALNSFPGDIESTPDPLLRTHLKLLQGNALLGAGMNREAREVFFQVYRICRIEGLQSDYRKISLKALMNAGLATKNLGDFKAAVQFYREVISTKILVAPSQEIQIRNLLGSLLTKMKDLTQAGVELYCALKLAQELGEDKLEADVNLNIAVLEFARNDSCKALEFFEKSRSLAGSDMERRIRVELNMGTLLCDQGEDEQAWVFFDKAQDYARRNDLERYLPLILTNLANIRQKQGVVREAVMLAEEASSLASKLEIDDQWIKDCTRKVIEENRGETSDDFHLAEVLITSYGMVAVSAAMHKVMHDVDALAGSDLPVLITGETGTGKELVASALHRAGVRSGRPFVPVNCPAIPETLFESTLFGHVKGAFTGADSDKMGLVELAEDGTLFLDEIGDLPLSIQPKLLRFLENGEFQRMGDENTRFSMARIVSATNRDLSELMQMERFREDLLMRISAFSMVLPALRNREEDRYFIAVSILDGLNKQNGSRKTFSAEALQIINNYPFPGNVRELKNAVMRGFQIAKTEITLDSLGLNTSRIANLMNNNKLGTEPLKTVSATPGKQKSDWRDIFSESVDVTGKAGLEEALQNLEQKIVTKALEYRRGDREKVAEDLGLSLRALKYKISKYGIKSRKGRFSRLEKPESTLGDSV
jgi:transcriptional regulator with GAF, ATPase, and Fis domain